MLRVEINQADNGWIVVGHLGSIQVANSIASTTEEALAVAKKTLLEYAEWKDRVSNSISGKPTA